MMMSHHWVVQDGVTGFHAGRFNPDKLDPADSAALASAISRYAPCSQAARMHISCTCVHSTPRKAVGRPHLTVLKILSHPTLQDTSNMMPDAWPIFQEPVC